MVSSPLPGMLTTTERENGDDAARSLTIRPPMRLRGCCHVQRCHVMSLRLDFLLASSPDFFTRTSSLPSHQKALSPGWMMVGMVPISSTATTSADSTKSREVCLPVES